MIKEYNKIKDALENLQKLKTLTNHLSSDKKEDMVNIDLEYLKDIEIPILKPKVKIKFKNESTNEDPTYFHDGDSGFDFRAYIPNYDPLKTPNIVVEAGKVSLVSTGLYFDIPKGYELQVRPRSGLAVKSSITVLNTPGTVDSNYRGEIKIILINLGETNFQIESGDRIAQGVIAPVLTSEWGEMIKVNKLSPSNREEGGFGSTGKK